MAARSKQVELQEDRERWLFVFRECFGEDCTAQDLQELKPTFVFSIYLQFAKIYLGASLDNMKLIGLNCPEDMQKYPETYEKSILTPKVAKLLSWFFNTRYGNSSFTFEDLFSASSARTRLFFNYIADFVYDYTEWQAKVDEIGSEVEQRKEGVAQLEAERDRLVSSIEQLRKQKAEKRIAEEEELQLKQALVKEVQAKKEEKAALKRQFEAMREEIAQLSESARQSNIECETLSETVRQLESCVVSEQERDCLKRREQQLRDVAADNANKKKQLSAVENLAGETERTIAALKNNILPLERDLRQELDKLSNLLNTEELTARQSRAVAAVNELDHETSVLRQRLARFEEERKTDKELRTKTIKGIEADIAAAREMLNQLRQTDENLKAGDKALTEQLEGVVAQLDALKDEAANIDLFFSDIQGRLVEAGEQHSNRTHAAYQRFIDEVRKRRIN